MTVVTTQLRRGIKEWIRDVSLPYSDARSLTVRSLISLGIVWALGRALNFFLLFLGYGAASIYALPFGPNAQRVTTFLNFLSDWDAARYGRISQIGYPLELPLDAYGNVIPNDWAFLPIFPWLERSLAFITGLPWQGAGIILAVTASAAATVMLFMVLRRVCSERAAWWAVVLFSFGPLSFVYAVGYADSLFLFFLFLALFLAQIRRYVWLIPVGVVTAFTRPGALALALCLALIFFVRWFRRRDDAFPAREWIPLLVSIGAVTVAGLSWTWVVDAATGMPNAYLLTETSWWTRLVGPGGFIPLTPWFRMGWSYLGIAGVLLATGLIAAFFVWMWSRPIRRLGLVVVSFGLSYGAYLIAVFLPQLSIFRLLLPLSPLLADERLSARRWRRVTSLCVVIVGQIVCVFFLWTMVAP